MNITRSIVALGIAILPMLQPQTATAQIKRLGSDVQYGASLQGVASSGQAAPFWFSSNRYGLGSIETQSALLRADIGRDVMTDSLRHWRLGYGASLVGATGHDSHFILQQLYADVQYKAIRLSIGQKERPMELKNQLLSSGTMTSGINARPIPQVRLELPDFWNIPGTKKWLALKAHVAYGAFTDNGWQSENRGQRGQYARNVLYHSKAGFLRIGNDEKFPLTLTGGLELYAQFGGEAWNVQPRDDDQSGFTGDHVDMGHGFRQFVDAFFLTGSDAADGDYKNVGGNQLGSWHLRLDYHGKGWKAAAYAEHFFEDHSQMFWQYAWKDMLYGVELQLPKNPIVSTLLYEHVRTTDQSGSIYHDATATIPDQISARDNYYNHGTFTGWHHAGRGIGSALLLSPAYNTTGALTHSPLYAKDPSRIYFLHNRITAHHLGVMGQPMKELGYRLLWTHEKSFGTYNYPLLNPQRGDFLLVELTYKPQLMKELCVTASYGMNHGTLLGNSHGAMITLSYNGLINKKK